MMQSINDFILILNNEKWLHLIILFTGLVCGWFCRNGSVFWVLFGLFVVSPIIYLLIAIDYWIATLSFILGFLIHTGEPLYRKISRL